MHHFCDTAGELMDTEIIAMFYRLGLTCRTVTQFSSLSSWPLPFRVPIFPRCLSIVTGRSVCKAQEFSFEWFSVLGLHPLLRGIHLATDWVNEQYTISNNHIEPAHVDVQGCQSHSRFFVSWTIYYWYFQHLDSLTLALGSCHPVY